MTTPKLGESISDSLLHFYRYDENIKYTGYACFDLDHTIIKPKSGKVFPKDRDDWILMPHVEKVLEILYKNGWFIVIFTNQSGLKSSKKLQIDDFIYKLSAIVNKLDLNIHILCSLSKDYYRKPMKGMWEEITQFHPQIIEKPNFYCGDAYNPSDKLKASDLKFAKNINIPFVYPEKIFIGNFNIDNINSIIDECSILTNTSVQTIPKFQIISQDEYEETISKVKSFADKYKILFMVSPPASGKTTFCKNVLSDFKRLSKDDYKTASQYKSAIKQNLENKNKIVLDNTNHTEKSRQTIFNILVKNNTINENDIGYIIMNIKKEDSMYLNKYRCYITAGKSKLLPDVAIHSYYKYLDEPHSNYIKINHTIKKLAYSNLLL